MQYTQEELAGAKFQIASALKKTKAVLETFIKKENSSRYKSQITLAQRRIEAFQIALALIEKEMSAACERCV